VTKATDTIEVPDYQSVIPHTMVRHISAFAVTPGMELVLPNSASDSSAYYAEYSAKVGHGLIFEVARSWKPEAYKWRILAFGATMLTMDLRPCDVVRIVVPHTAAICPVCVERFKTARRSAGLNSEED
jgi:hypothetical protein